MYYRIIVREKIENNKLGPPKQECLMTSMTSACIHKNTLEYCFGEHYSFTIEEFDLCTK